MAGLSFGGREWGVRWIGSLAILSLEQQIIKKSCDYYGGDKGKPSGQELLEMLDTPTFFI